MRHRRILLAFSVVMVTLLLSACSLRAQSEQPEQSVACAEFASWEWAQSAYERERGPSAASPPGGACPNLPHGAAPALWTDSLPEAVQAATVVNIVDGDTVDVQLRDGVGAGTVERLRLTLIDTPETKDPSKPVQCFGTEATAFTTWLLGQADGGTVYLERDVSDRDRYNRLLRYVWLEIDGQPYLANEALARSGFGTLSTYPPDVKYLDEIGEAQTFAREHGLGLWRACGGPGMPAVTAVPAVPTPTSPLSMPPGTPSTVTVQLRSLVLPGDAGGLASIEVVTAPGVACTITTRYGNRPLDEPGTEPHYADANGQVGWSWNVGARTTPGNWAITVTCGGGMLSVTVQAS